VDTTTGDPVTVTGDATPDVTPAEAPADDVPDDPGPEAAEATEAAG
jgi:hypothetical protein